MSQVHFNRASSDHSARWDPMGQILECPIYHWKQPSFAQTLPPNQIKNWGLMHIWTLAPPSNFYRQLIRLQLLNSVPQGCNAWASVVAEAWQQALLGPLLLSAPCNAMVFRSYAQARQWLMDQLSSL